MRPSAAKAVAILLLPGFAGACNGPAVIRTAYPLTELPAESASREIHEYAVDHDRAVRAVQSTLDAMQYRVESCNAEFGLVTARGGMVVYNQTLVAAGTVIINGAIIAVGAISGAHQVPGAELDSRHEYRVFVQVWRHPSDGPTRVRATILRSTTGSLGSTHRDLEGSPEQYAAFFTILDRELRATREEVQP